MSNEENKKGKSSSHPAKRPKMINNCPGPKIYTSSIADYKWMVRCLTSTFGRSSGETSLGVPTQAQATNPQPNDAFIPPGSSGHTSLRVPPTQAQISNPQPIRLNDAPIPPGSSGQTRLLRPRQANVRNPRSMGLYDHLPSRSLPYPFPPGSVWPPTSATGTSNAQASSPRPSLPSSPVPPSVPEMLPTSPAPQWSPPSAPLVPARLPGYPPSSPSAAPVLPSPPQEQGEREPMFDDIENYLNEDVDYNYVACSSLPSVTGNSNGEQQRETPPVLTNQPSGSLNLPDPQNGLTTPPSSQHGSNSLYENVAPQVLTNQPLGSLNLPDPQNGFTMPASEHGSNSLYENVAPQVHATLPSGIAPPVHATLPFVNNLSAWSTSQNGLESTNVTPSVAPSGPDHSNDQQEGPSLGWPYPQNGLQQGTVPSNVPSGSSYMSHHYSTEEKQIYLAQIGFGAVPSWRTDWNSYPRTLLRSTNNPSSSSTPANLPPGDLQG